jgi:hypothetical protein
VAISPLLGVGAIGAWEYCSAPSVAARARLPWFAQPWFWVPALVIVGLCALKDVFGMAIPPMLKKPFDVLETIQHKVSGLIAVGAFVPMIASVFRSTGGAVPASLNAAKSAHGFLAVMNSSWIYNGLFAVALMSAFFFVFLASNAINILILLSPFPLVDAALKLFRLLVLFTVVASAVINPWLGAIWSLVIIVIAYFIAGWSFRLSHFGAVFLWDFCTVRRNRFTPHRIVNRMFLGRATEKVPVRTYGRFYRDGKGRLAFDYRPWLVLPTRTLTLPDGTYAVSNGLIYSEIVRLEGNQSRSVMLLPPRYRSHEPELVAIYGLAGVRAAGLRAMFVWIKEWMGFKPRPQLAAA